MYHIHFIVFNGLIGMMFVSCNKNINAEKEKNTGL